MITLPRVLARQFRAVLRRSLLAVAPRGPDPLVRVRAGDDGLSLTACRPDCSLLYRDPGPLPPDEVVFPSRYLAEFEAARGTVELEAVSFGKGRARWEDGGVPRCLDLDTVVPDGLPDPPAEPERWAEVGPAFLLALAEAARTASRDNIRYSLSRVQLRGKRGQLAATDGRQLLVQGGFRMPWAEDVLVASLPAFACRELMAEEQVAIGRTEKFVTLRVGRWTLFLEIDTESRFPDADAVIPREDGKATRLHLSEEDARFLLHALPKMPGKDEELAPVTLDLADAVVVRARAEGAAQAGELILTGSHCRGPAVRAAVNRRYLHRLAQLGFREVEVAGPSRPLVCRDDSRVFVFMPLDADAVVPPEPGALRVASGGTPTAAPPRPKLQARRRETPVTEPPPAGPPRRNGDAGAHRPSVPQEADDAPDLVAEAEALRELLHDAQLRLGRLLAGLKQQRRQSRVLQAAVQSLRGLRLDR